MLDFLPRLLCQQTPGLPRRLQYATTWALFTFLTATSLAAGEDNSFAQLRQEYDNTTGPLVVKYCLECHSSEAREGELDLERFATFDQVRHDPQAWQKVAVMLRSDEMPPEDSPQPTSAEKTSLREWVKQYLNVEARTNAGDPGPVVLRRLNNAEYTYTIRDLTNVSLSPTLEFPTDGAAGEGFTNTGGAQAMSPSMVTKYLAASKGVADHLVLLPEGFRFSPSKTRRDWTNEILASIREMYFRYAGNLGDANTLNHWDGIDPTKLTNSDGRVNLETYFKVLIQNRDRLQEDISSTKEIAQNEGLSETYLQHLAQMLTADEPSLLLKQVQQQWLSAQPDDARAIAKAIRVWQERLWKFNPVGHFGQVKGWQEPVTPLLTETDVLLPGVSVVVRADSEAGKRYQQSFDEFRAIFPAAMCYSRIVPVDVGVTLLLYYREDDQLSRLMLSEEERNTLDRLWDELHFVSQDALALVTGYEQLLEFATQDDDPSKYQPLGKEIHAAADAFRAQSIESEPHHLDALVDFAGRAYRRPLEAAEEDSLRQFYAQLRTEEMSHDEALRLTLARVLTSPDFLYRLERPHPGPERSLVSDWEFANRLSYFLWSSAPDRQLLDVAASGLKDPATITAETRRLVQDPRVRRLAIEFACQWLHIRNFDQHDEKSERHFPTFANLRDDMYEESIRFFTDLFQNDGSVLDILDADHTFLNEALATHYGIPGVEGETWRRVEGVRAYSRGGIFAQATMLASQSGASRTSLILRGNWVSETLLGERLPRPPKEVPVLPQTVPADLTERQLIEQHSSDPSCAKCHARIDPYGIALEGFDAIGRFREKDAGGHKIDTRSTLLDGTTIDGIDDLRTYFLTTRRQDFVRHFCRKLLGYALGRAVQLSDEPLLDEMMANLTANDFHISHALETIVLSDQFRMIRGLDYQTGTLPETETTP